MKNKLLLIFLLITISHASPSPASPMDSLVDRVLSAYGGKMLEAVDAYRMEGVVTARMRKTEGEMIRLFARPDRLFVDLAYPENPERRYLDGENGWRTDPGGAGVRKVEGHLLKAMVLQAARAEIPWILSRHREDVTQIPPLKVGQQMTVGMQIILGPGLVLRLYADPQTARVIYSQAILNAEKIKTHFETAYSDFREVDGVLFAHHEENWASGFHTGSTVIEKVEINPEIDDSTFRPE